MQRKFIFLIVVVLIVGSVLYWLRSQTAENSEYNPKINPANFTIKITNPHFSLSVGKKITYAGDALGGTEKTEINVLTETRKIMGVETLVYSDKVWLNGELIEDTKDYLAQDKEGNVWYFGEEAVNMEKGKVLDHKGSWIAGVDGALPGIWLKANNKVGDSYRQEYYKGQAEDMTDVIATNVTVKTKLATYLNCLKMFDWTPLNPESKENKYYCPEVGALVLIEENGKKVELTSVRQ